MLSLRDFWWFLFCFCFFVYCVLMFGGGWCRVVILRFDRAGVFPWMSLAQPGDRASVRLVLGLLAGEW